VLRPNNRRLQQNRACVHRFMMQGFEPPVLPSQNVANLTKIKTLGTEQIVRASSERFERATVVALDPIVLLVAPN
jgi:hypothetical protein